MALNPWRVESITAFNYFCCPECVYRSQEEFSFQSHALQNHPLSHAFFSNVKETFDEKLDTVIPLDEPVEDEEKVQIKQEVEAITELLDPTSVIKSEVDDYDGFDNDAFNIEADYNDDIVEDVEDDNDNDPDFEFLKDVKPKVEKKPKVKRTPKTPKAPKAPKIKAPKVVKSEDGLSDLIFKCDFCPLEFANFRRRSIHVRATHFDADGTIPCDQCEHRATSMKALWFHKHQRHDFKPCPECGKVFQRGVLKKHIQAVHPDKAGGEFLSCEHCNYTTKVKKYFENHTMRCYAKFKDHIKKTNEDKTMYKCQECSSMYDSIKILVRHYMKEHKKLPPELSEARKVFMCDQCPDMYFTQKGLDKHVAKDHKQPNENGTEEPKPAAESKPEYIYDCVDCNQTFRGISLYIRHYKKFHGDAMPPDLADKDLICCEKCPTYFESKKSLASHVWYMHTRTAEEKQKKRKQKEKNKQRRQKNTTCPLCGKTFKWEKNCKEHIQVIHENITPFQCDECPKSFGNNRMLFSHKRIVHTKVNCDICGKQIYNPYELMRHKATEHGIIPPNVYLCDFCPSIFRFKQNLHTHLKNKHPFEMKLTNEDDEK